MSLKDKVVLILAGSNRVAEKIILNLARSNFRAAYSIADSANMMRELLIKEHFDVILAANTAEPGSIISCAHELSGFTPVILIMDEISDEDYVSLLKRGAFDCVPSNDLGCLARMIKRSIIRDESLEETLFKLRKLRKNIDEVQSVAKLGSWEWDIVNNTVDCSDEVYRIMGFDPKQDKLFKGITDNYVDPEDRRRLAEAQKTAIENHTTYELDYKMLTADGREVYIFTQGKVIYGADGKPLTMHGYMQDITERKSAELENKMKTEKIREADLELTNQNVLLNAVIENMHDALIIYDEGGRITHINAQARRMYKLTDLTMAESVYESHQVYDEQHNVLPREAYPTQRAFRGETVQNERLIIKSARSSQYVEANAIPIFQNGNQLIAVILSHHDITEMINKQSEIEEQLKNQQQLNKQLNRQAKLLNLSNEAIFAWYLDGPIIYWNQGAEKMYGFAEEDAIGCSPHALLKSKFPVHYKEIKSTLLKQGAWHGILEHTIKDGSLKFIEARLQVIINESGLNTVMETNRDISDRLKAEKQNKKYAEELQNIINSSPDFIWSLDSDYRYIFYNTAVSDFVKRTYGTILRPGLSVSEAFPPEGAAIYLDFFERVKKDGAFQIDVQSYRGNRLVTFSFIPIYDNTELVEIIVFGKDITERIKMEQDIIKLNTSLEARVAEGAKALQESGKVLQNFSLTITHDLKAPLQEIADAARQIQNHAAIDSNSEKITHISAKMSSMIQSVLDYEKASKIQLKREMVDIKKLIVSAYEELKKDNTVLEFETGIPKVCADRTQIRKVLFHLISNAVKFSHKQESVKITVGCKKENNEYVFSIKDNGIGFDPAHAEKLFTVFERLTDSEEYEGHGLGLAIVKSIVEKHGGRTWITGKRAKGTSVYFTLPVKEEN